jgi:hypothetical protein
VGDLSIETGGEASRLTISQIDRPQDIADHINERSQREHSKACSAEFVQFKLCGSYFDKRPLVA